MSEGDIGLLVILEVTTLLMLPLDVSKWFIACFFLHDGGQTTDLMLTYDISSSPTPSHIVPLSRRLAGTQETSHPDDDLCVKDEDTAVDVDDMPEN